jgi:hypothetical protein
MRAGWPTQIICVGLSSIHLCIAMILHYFKNILLWQYPIRGVAVVVNAIKEDNPNVSDEILRKIQNAIEGHYAKFEADQVTKVDAVTIYRAQADADTFPRGFLAQTFGFPRIDLDALDKVIMSEEASEAFQTGKLGPVDPFSSGTKE